MSKQCLTLCNVSFQYPTASTPVFDELTVQLPQGWTGVIGPNGSGKTTLLRLVCGKLTPTAGEIHSPGRLLYCSQHTDSPLAEFDMFLQGTDAIACRLRGQLGIEEDWQQRWPTLSHGERKRAQIGVALWKQPNVLAIDEPTNHIDLADRKLLAEALEGFDGVGLLVSHDRELLDRLCKQTLFIEPPVAVIRPGGYSVAVKLAAAEQLEAHRAHAQAKAQLKRLEREVTKRRSEAARSHQKRSRRKIPRKDHDAMARIGMARLTGKDGQAGRLLRQLNGRLAQAKQKLADIYLKKQYRLGIDMPGSRARRDVLFRLRPGSVPLGQKRRLVFGELLMKPGDRVALIGPNGAGKSTLIRHIVGGLELPAEKVVYLAQEIDQPTARELIRVVRQLPKDQLDDVMTIVSCLGSQPQRLMETRQPSPGELRKIMLALGIARQAYLIIMDEPTNHLDLPSIECLESALAECPAALLLVSHDLRFLRKLTRTRWEISPDQTRKQMQLRVVPQIYTEYVAE